MTKCVVCVICVGKHPISEANPMSEEHVVPDFMGGGLVKKFVCKTCNSRMGSSFEARLNKSLLFKFFAYQNNVKGKNGPALYPLCRDYWDKKTNVKFKVRPDGGVVIIDEKRSVSKVGTQLYVNASSCSKSLLELQADLEKSISRHTGQETSKIKKTIADFVRNHFTQKERSYSLEAEIQDEINLDDIALVFAKISYELACIELGDKYINDPFAARLRDCLYEQSLLFQDIVHFPVEPEALYLHVLPSGHHWVVLFGNMCYVSIYGISGIVFYSIGTTLTGDIENGIAYRFSYKTGEHCRSSLFDAIQVETQTK